MKRETGVRVPRIAVAIVAFLFLLPSLTFAAPAAAQKSTQQVQPAGGAAASVLNPNAPPQGTITITTPQSGAKWYTGMYYPIRWTCNSTRSNSVTISLWENGRAQTQLIATGQTTGNYAYIVPQDINPNLPMMYELRVTNEGDTRVEARLPITIAATTVKLDDPAGYYMVTGSSYTVSWSYTGNLASVNLAILDSSGAVLQSVQNISIGSNGKGSWSWSVPVPYGGQSLGQYRIQISAMLPTSVTSTAKTETVLDRTSLFYVRLPKIGVDSGLRAANVAECSPGRTYNIQWTSELNGKPVKVELYKAYGGTAVRTIQANVASQATNSISWTVPDIPETRDRTQYLDIRVTSLDFPAVKGDSDNFSCEMPGIKLSSPDTQQILVLNQTYQIAWGYQGDPGPHVRIDTLQSDAGGYNMKVYNTPAASTAVQGSSGKWGQGQFSWTPTDRPFGKQFYIMITGVENSSVYDRRQYTIVDKCPPGADCTASGSGTGTTGTATTGTVTTGTGTTGTGTTGTGTTGTGTGGGTTTQQLKQNTSIRYNSNGSSATFFAGTTVTLDGNGYAVNGYLSPSDQSIYYSSGKTARFYGGSYVTFSGGYVTSGLLSLTGNQSLEYKSGKFVPFLPGGKITLSNGYVVSGYLALGADQLLDYASGKSARFMAGSFVNIGNGYVSSGYLSLASNQPLDYSSGKSAQFMAGSFVAFRSGGYVKSAFVGVATTFATTKGNQAVPAMSYVTFDDNGYLASFNPPGFSACYKCNTSTDPTCSNTGGLPLCPPGK